MLYESAKEIFFYGNLSAFSYFSIDSSVLLLSRLKGDKSALAQLSVRSYSALVKVNDSRYVYLF